MGELLELRRVKPRTSVVDRDSCKAVQAITSHLYRSGRRSVTMNVAENVGHHALDERTVSRESEGVACHRDGSIGIEHPQIVRM
jgi:hypothetical protein